MIKLGKPWHSQVVLKDCLVGLVRWCCSPVEVKRGKAEREKKVREESRWDECWCWDGEGVGEGAYIETFAVQTQLNVAMGSIEKQLMQF